MKANNRRQFLKTMLAAGTASVLPNFSKRKIITEQLKPSLKDKKILMVWGGWKGHEPKKCIDMLAPWAEAEGAKVTVSNTLDSYLDKELMQSLDLIVQVFTMGKITKEQEQGLLEAVRNGAGMAGWHGGMCDAFRQNTKYQFMTGGQWVSHPGGIIDYSVQITDHDDLVTEGIPDFNMKSEQYYMHIDPNVKVLATTTFTDEHSNWIGGCVVPVVWKKYYDNGRIFYLSLGHQLDHLQVPETLEMIQRGIRWASESKYHPKEEWKRPVYA